MCIFLILVEITMERFKFSFPELEKSFAIEFILVRFCVTGPC